MLRFLEKWSVVPSEPVCLPADRPNLFADQICCVEYSSLSCALMLNFTLFEEDALLAVTCISHAQIKFAGLVEIKLNYFCYPGVSVSFFFFLIERVGGGNTRERSESLTFSSGDLWFFSWVIVAEKKNRIPGSASHFAWMTLDETRQGQLWTEEKCMAPRPHCWSFLFQFSFSRADHLWIPYINKAVINLLCVFCSTWPIMHRIHYSATLMAWAGIILELVLQWPIMFERETWPWSSIISLALQNDVFMRCLGRIFT